jgi:hypothetical protein
MGFSSRDETFSGACASRGAMFRRRAGNKPRDRGGQYHNNVRPKVFSSARKAPAKYARDNVR